MARPYAAKALRRMAASAGAAPAAEHWIYGRHAVRAALANPLRRWRVLIALAGHEAEAQALVAGALARQRDAADRVRVLDRAGIAALLPAGAVHQGLALR